MRLVLLHATRWLYAHQIRTRKVQNQPECELPHPRESAVACNDEGASGDRQCTDRLVHNLHAPPARACTAGTRISKRGETDEGIAAIRLQMARALWRDARVRLVCACAGVLRVVKVHAQCVGPARRMVTRHWKCCESVITGKSAQSNSIDIGLTVEFVGVKVTFRMIPERPRCGSVVDDSRAPALWTVSSLCVSA